MSVQKFVVLSPHKTLSQASPVVLSTGPSDSGQLIALNPMGQIDPSMLPAGYGTGSSGGSSGPVEDILTLTATQTISAYLAVSSTTAGLVPSDPTDVANCSSTLGVSTNGALTGQSVVIRTFGPLTYNGWNWTLGSPVYVGAGGVPTQTPPTSGYLRILGVPISPSTLLIELQPPVIIN